MIPRDILKKTRQIEIRTNRIVTESGQRTRTRGIPTGFWNKAQGCEERATLGRLWEIPPTATGLRHVTFVHGRNPVGVVVGRGMVTQGSSFLATLGWRTQSLWDWHNAQRLGLRSQTRPVHFRRS